MSVIRNYFFVKLIFFQIATTSGDKWFLRRSRGKEKHSICVVVLTVRSIVQCLIPRPGRMKNSFRRVSRIKCMAGALSFNFKFQILSFNLCHGKVQTSCEVVVSFYIKLFINENIKERVNFINFTWEFHFTLSVQMSSDGAFNWENLIISSSMILDLWWLKKGM